MLLRAVAAIVACLPWRALAWPGALLAWLAGSLARIRRGHVEHALGRAGVAAPRAVARAMYRGLGQGALELLWVAGASPARREAALAESVVFAPGAREALDVAASRGPVVLAGSHTGNWELAAGGASRHLAAASRKLVVVAKPLSDAVFDRFARRLRDALGVRTIAPLGAARACLAHLAAGDVVVMPIDQVPDRARHGLLVPFLGAPAPVDRAPFVIAARARATVLVTAASREGHVTRLEVLDVIAPGPGAAELAARATSALDAFVRRAPASWMWLHRRWAAPRGARTPLSGAEKPCIEGAWPPRR